MKIIAVDKIKFLKEFPNTEENVDNCKFYYSEEKCLGIIKYPDDSIVSKMKEGFNEQSFSQRDDFDLLIALTNGDNKKIEKELSKSLYEIQAIEELEDDDIGINGYPEESKSMKIKRFLIRGLLLASALLIIYGTYILSNLLSK